jgi:hypothetical protein
MTGRPDIVIVDGDRLEWTIDDRGRETGAATAEACGFTRVDDPPREIYVRKAGSSMLRLSRVLESEDGTLTYATVDRPFDYARHAVKIFTVPVQSRAEA